MVGLRLNTSFKEQLRVEAYHVFMQLCIKLIIMEIPRKFFQTKVRSDWFKNAFFCSTFGGYAAAAILQRTKCQTPGRSSNVGGVSAGLEHLT
jgi:hypothetical protein